MIRVVKILTVLLSLVMISLFYLSSIGESESYKKLIATCQFIEIGNQLLKVSDHQVLGDTEHWVQQIDHTLIMNMCSKPIMVKSGKVFDVTHTEITLETNTSGGYTLMRASKSDDVRSSSSSMNSIVIKTTN
jgi:hypothetical protein